MKKYLTILLIASICHFSSAQKKSDMLLTIDEQSVTVDEFLRIYNKNSSITIEDKKSVDEYLDLFIDYKLKVIEAEKLGYDTMSSFVKEMDGYTKQLAKPYLDKSEMLDSFVNEAYNHYLEEVNASHILLKINKIALPEDTLKAYNRLMEMRSRVQSGEDWDAVIDDASPADPGKRIGGDLGWFTVFRMVYPFEAAAYNTPVGEISLPVRTQYGYHLIKVNDRRKFKGEVAVSHIMVIVPPEPNDLDVEAAKEKINKAYDVLVQGDDWDTVTKTYSEHRSTSGNGGSLGWLTSGGGTPEELMDACYALDTGKFSEPFRTKYGFHIVKVSQFKGPASFEEKEEEFAKKVKNTGAILQITADKLLDRIKKKNGFTYYEDRMEGIYAAFDSTLYTGEWDPTKAEHLTETLFVIGDSTYTQYQAAKKAGSRRLSNKGVEMEVSIRKRVMEFIDEKIKNYEIADLPNNYPEYKNLLQEYHDGILLFNLTEVEVWKKAVEDSIGLEDFYNNLPEKYQWEERIALSKYTYSDSSLTDKLLEIAKIRAQDSIDAKQVSLEVCGQDTIPCIKLNELKYEKGDNAVADGMEWKKSTYSITNDKKDIVLYFVDEILPTQLKGLQDARGLYTADYQSHLEKIWVKGLREKYPIEINEKVLNKVRKQESGK